MVACIRSLGGVSTPGLPARAAGRRDAAHLCGIDGGSREFDQQPDLRGLNPAPGDWVDDCLLALQWALVGAGYQRRSRRGTAGATRRGARLARFSRWDPCEVALQQRGCEVCRTSPTRWGAGTNDRSLEAPAEAI